jgi:hypothetical protein
MKVVAKLSSLHRKDWAAAQVEALALFLSASADPL